MISQFIINLDIMEQNASLYRSDNIVLSCWGFGNGYAGFYLRILILILVSKIQDYWLGKELRLAQLVEGVGVGLSTQIRPPISSYLQSHLVPPRLI